jgi:uncharacterized integral membrane protein
MSGLPERINPNEGRTETPNLWAGPLFTLLLLLVPTLILVFSNGQSTDLKFAGLGWTAPLWLILLATFVVGILAGRVFGWGWRAFRRRRARMKAGASDSGQAA